MVLAPTAVAAIAATFVLMGLIVGAYGPLLEHLTHRFGVSLPVAGATISVHFAGSLPGVLIAMRSFRVLPARVTVMIATAVVSLGLVGVALAFAWSFFLVAVFVIGLGFGALVLGVNQLVAYSEGRRRAALLNALNGGYSAGAVVGPLVVAAFAAEHFSVLFLVAAIAWLALIPGAVGITGRLPVGTGTSGRPGRLVSIFIVAFVLYVAIENGTGGWMTSHLEYVGLRSTEAATVTSGFWLALVTGRLLMTLVPPSIPADHGVLRRRGSMGIHRDGARARPDLSDRDRLARQAAAGRLARHLVAFSGRVHRRHRRSRRDRDRDRAGGGQLGAGRPGRGRDRDDIRFLRCG